MKLSEHFFPHRILVRETEWARHYNIGENRFYYESKFVADGLEISNEEFRSRWPRLSDDEKLDLVQAYALKRMTTEDERILHFLMEFGSEVVCAMIAAPLIALPEKDKVLVFLTKRMETTTAAFFPNYAQALGLLGHPGALEVLTRKFEQLKAQVFHEMGFRTNVPFNECVSLLACSKALVTLAGSRDAESVLEVMQSYPDERIRAIAQNRNRRGETPSSLPAWLTSVQRRQDPSR